MVREDIIQRKNICFRTPPTVLIVDDDSLWHGLLGRLFTCHGYALLAATSCATAIETAKLGKPDCIVLDFNLGDGDATTVCAAIRAQEGHKIPIIIFSSDPGAEECVSRDRLADKFILKNSPLEKLLAAVDEIMTAHKQGPDKW